MGKGDGQEVDTARPVRLEDLDWTRLDSPELLHVLPSGVDGVGLQLHAHLRGEEIDLEMKHKTEQEGYGTKGKGGREA